MHYVFSVEPIKAFQKEFSLTDTTSRGHFSAKIAAKETFNKNKMYQFLFMFVVMVTFQCMTGGGGGTETEGNTGH